jgi:rubrerythrin
VKGNKYIDGRKYMGNKITLEEGWRLAIEKEREAQQFYKQLLEMTDDAALQSLLSFLVDQEVSHEQLLQDEYDRMFMPEM